MRVEIDQSGKIEDTNRDTILAFSNNQKYSLKISSKVKRQLQEIFRRKGKIRIFIFRVFAAGIYLLITPFLDDIKAVIIDREYPGHEAQIKDMILGFVGRNHLKKFPEVYFRNIGKRSRAHDLATKVVHRKARVDKVLSLQKLADLTMAIKNDRASQMGPRTT